MLHKKGLDKEYAAITGVADFNSAAAKLAFGGDSHVIKEGLVSFACSRGFPSELWFIP